MINIRFYGYIFVFLENLFIFVIKDIILTRIMRRWVLWLSHITLIILYE